MTNTKIILLVLGAIISLLASLYSFLSVAFYSWLEASQQWSTVRASIWAIGALIIGILLFATFIYCVKKIIRGINERNRQKTNAE